ncbi:MAG: arnB 2 [Bacteroidota bacterium]|nr:arnB 2 [Bacteroidota bacterium]
MATIQMVNLKEQYIQLKDEIDQAILECLNSCQFIGGPAVKQFENNLSKYLSINHVIGCGNGTDALEIALMALNLPKGSKIIVPAFTYIAPVEVIALMGMIPVYADVDPDTFNITLEEIEKVYTDDVKGIVAVHLFGQPCNTDEIYKFAVKKNIFLIEDNAQSIGAEKKMERNTIITTSFFPSKNLGAYGDGGALMTNDDKLAKRIRIIANHGQQERYYHEEIGINSRLDAIQAAVLSVKLNYVDQFIAARQKAADFYDGQLKNILKIQTPVRVNTHTFHQYTLKIKPVLRDGLKSFLFDKGIDTAMYYPVPCYKQQAYLDKNARLPNTELLCSSVLSLPIYPEITDDQLLYICNCIKEFFKNN